MTHPNLWDGEIRLTFLDGGLAPIDIDRRIHLLGELWIVEELEATVTRGQPAQTITLRRIYHEPCPNCTIQQELPHAVPLLEAGE